MRGRFEVIGADRLWRSFFLRRVRSVGIAALLLVSLCLTWYYSVNATYLGGYKVAGITLRIRGEFHTRLVIGAAVEALARRGFVTS